MKKISAILATCLVAGLMTISTMAVMPVSANNSLDDVISSQSQQGGNGGADDYLRNQGIGGDVWANVSGNEDMVQNMQDATKLDETSAGANKANRAIKKIASVVVQVLSYAITALLVVRVLLDLLFITIPFTRTLLSNGYQGQAQGGQQGQPGMAGGMGGGFGGGFGGGMGMSSGMGMSGGMGMGGPAGAQQQGAKIQWVSNAALNAVASEQAGTSALKIYAKDMIVILVLTPIFLVLAVTGVLTNLGFILGGGLVDLISGIGGMV